MNHKMGPDVTAVCGEESWDLAISWANVQCENCLKFRPTDAPTSF